MSNKTRQTLKTQAATGATHDPVWGDLRNTVAYQLAMIRTYRAGMGEIANEPETAAFVTDTNECVRLIELLNRDSTAFEQRLHALSDKIAAQGDMNRKVKVEEIQIFATLQGEIMEIANDMSLVCQPVFENINNLWIAAQQARRNAGVVDAPATVQ